MANIYTTFSNAIKNNQLVGLATIIAGPGIGNKMLIQADGGSMGTLGAASVDAQVRARAADLLSAQRSDRFSLTSAGEPVEIFIEVHAPPARLIIVGAVHIAIALVTFGKALNLQTIVLDARAAFATADRFSHADQLIIGWPADTLAAIGIDPSTFLVVLTHDEKIDNPVLALALRSPARYIGALGSKKTHARRVETLQAEGIMDAQLARLYAPIGLNIGAAPARGDRRVDYGADRRGGEWGRAGSGEVRTDDETDCYYHYGATRHR